MGALRIVGGDWRGRPLETPAGRDTRPTTDRTREQIASMVLSSFGLDLTGVRVLDAFAGSGALGLEMLSRGALSCVFVEADRRCAQVLRRNCASLPVGSAAKVVCGDVLRLAEGRPGGGATGGVPGGGLVGGPFGLVLLDPPYAMEAARVSRLVAALRAGGMLTTEARVLYERSAKAPGLAVEGLALRKSKERGVTGVDLMVFEEREA
jgi:16S rRNA (guanine966-N2)-methyltransferase